MVEITCRIRDPLGASGDRFTYYVTAYTENSPESFPSRWVFIYGGISKHIAIIDSIDYLNSQKAEKSINIDIYPNPFNPETKISYHLPREDHVRLSVFNITGQHIDTLVDQRQSAGKHTVQFSGQALPAGIYFVRLKLSNRQLTRQLLLFK
mgnify:CR=1 FL=1